MTKAERSLAAAGHEEFVLQARRAMQHTMREDLTAAVEAAHTPQGAAFMSDNHIEPGLAAEVFVLDEPVDDAYGNDRSPPGEVSQ